ncbi:bifunctional lysylphosphatidylglycerol synthetase/lysine--tRNA ligase LysX [Rothia sp. P13129]|uniref:bifunctional lysylphosphatidylglycerol synthetase/lysine--tRNA ligase LysX n=1 Tax=unclassified Rothia (in: high G+C Gram-positive bacteria) TaxID=2689056 RepID=UPI003AC11CC3
MKINPKTQIITRTWKKLTSHAEYTARWVIGIYTISSALAFFSWVLTPFHKNHVGYPWWEILLGAMNIPVDHTLVSAIVLILITTALIRRRRVGLYAVVFFQYAGILVTIPGVLQTLGNNQDFKHLFDVYSSVANGISLIFALCALVLLYSCKSAFPAHTVRSRWKQAVTSLIIGVLATWCVALLMGYIQERIGFGTLWKNTLEYGFSVVNISPLGASDSSHRLIHFFKALIDLCYALTIIITIAVVLRTPADQKSWNQDNELELRTLIREYGDKDSLSYFATRREKSMIFSDDRRAVITYRLIYSVALASGDPIGAPSSWDSAIKNWMTHARTYGWTPGVISASERGAKAYAQAGLAITYMGDEAILNAERFSINNTSLAEVRHATRKLNHDGYTINIRRHADVSRQDMDSIISLVDQWRHGAEERGFSMALNRLGDSADGKCVLITAESPDGKIVGILSFVPWGKNGISLDVMRRSPQAPNGLMEFMIATTMQNLPTIGITKVSLNFAMFRKTFVEADHFGASPWTRLVSSTLGILNRFLQLERLYRFNQKFDPVWEPRYIAADSMLTLSQVCVSSGVAEGFLPALLVQETRHLPTLDDEHLHRLHELENRTDTPCSFTPRYTDQTKHRIRHLNLLKEYGINPYPLGISTQYTAGQLADFLTHAGGTPTGTITVAGRVRSIRSHGAVVFLTLKEGFKEAQVVCEQQFLNDFHIFRQTVDRGDILVFTGILGTSRNGTPSLLAHRWTLGAKSLHDIPFEQFTDPETRLHRRSTDLIVHPKQREYIRMRSAVITSLRKTLDASGFLEVETPILHTIHGGASARPFKTFINAYGSDLYLRIAPELYLKRLVAGDMGAVYEIGRNFRNEGADATHNPEFTVLEAYKPYADYKVMLDFTQSLIKNVAYSIFGSESLPLGERKDGKRHLIDISAQWPVKTVCEALSEVIGEPISLDTDFEVLLDHARTHGIYVRDDMGAGAIIEELYGELVEPQTIYPTFYIDFPQETSPLAGAHRSHPGLAERWDLVIDGMELGTAYSEMADALEQRRRLNEQSLKAAIGDVEAMEVDEDFLYALEVGLPPTGGLGIGVDRLVMLLAGQNIRDVLTFPFVKPSR